MLRIKPTKVIVGDDKDMRQYEEVKLTWERKESAGPTRTETNESDRRRDAHARIGLAGIQTPAKRK